MVVCPKCKSEKVQIISKSSTKYYCVSCNYAWDYKNKIGEPEGSLDFSGAISAKRIFDVLTKGQDFTPEFRAALETQITSVIFEQWFEGFKAGQMASILYAKEFYGKDRDGTNKTVSGREGGDASTSKKDPGEPIERKGSITRAGQRRRAEDGGIEGYGAPEVRTRIGPVELRHPRNVKVPESVEKQVAYLFQEVWGGNTYWIKSLTFDGRLILEIDHKFS